MTTTTEKAATLAERLAAAVPEDAELRAAIAAVKAAPSSQTDVPREKRELVRTLAQEVQASGQWPSDAAERLLEVERRAEQARALTEVKQGVARHLDDLLREAHADAVEPQLELLRSELDVILGRARELDAVLGTVTSAQEAIEAGTEVIETWTELGEVVDRWREVLAAHERLIRPAQTSPLAFREDLYREFGTVRGRRALWPVRWRSGAVVPPPWPAVPGAEEDGPSPDRAGLRWTATRLPDPELGAEAWLPSLLELREEQAAHTSDGPADEGALPPPVLEEIEPGSGVMQGGVTRRPRPDRSQGRRTTVMR